MKHKTSDMKTILFFLCVFSFFSQTKSTCGKITASACLRFHQNVTMPYRRMKRLFHNDKSNRARNDADSQKACHAKRKNSHNHRVLVKLHFYTLSFLYV
jgi:hypothetical protein